MSDQTEPATPEHLKNVAERGDMGKSTDFTVALSGLFWWLALSLLFVQGLSLAIQWMAIYVDEVVSVSRQPRFQPLGGQLLFFAGITLSIPCGIGLAVALIGELAQTRGQLATKRDFMAFERMNPIEGLKQFFNAQKLGDMVIALFRFLVLAGVMFLVGAQLFRAAPLMLEYTWQSLASLFGVMLLRVFMWAVIVCLPIALIDLIWKKAMWKRRNKMSKEQVKREHKDTEGDPHMRGQRQQLHREVLSR